MADSCYPIAHLWSRFSKLKSTLIGLVIALLSINAIAQSVTTQVSANLAGINETFCLKTGTKHAACKNAWESPDTRESAAVHDVANATYGKLVSDASASVSCTQNCTLSLQSVAESQFTDTLNVQDAPESGSNLLITVSLKGSISSSQASPNLQLNLNGGNSAMCYVTSPGTCSTQLPVNGPSQSFDFELRLVSSVVASLNDSGGAASDSESGLLSGSVTKLAVVDGKGKVIKTVVIQTGSGHKYPL